VTDPDRPVRRPLPRRARRLVALATAAGVAAAPAAVVALSDGAAAAPTPPTFQRINIDTGVTGASFTSVGSVYAGETNIVTSGYGALAAGGKPSGGGTLQVYRPTSANLNDWTKVKVFDETANIIFPNAATVADVDEDGDNDIIVPSGYFFDTDPADPHDRGAITWWENTGAATPFVRHDVVVNAPWSYHGVQLVDLDKDGEKDIVTTGEQAKSAGDLYNDDLVQTQFFKGNGDGTFQPAVVLATQLGGSQPVVRDVDGDSDLDIITSQYFRTIRFEGDGNASAATFLWLENTRSAADVDPLAEADFAPHTIATLKDTPAGRGVGMGFQIQPIVGFRAPGKVSWIGTNHVNRCQFGAILPVREQVIEFVPGADIRAPWGLTTLSDPTTATPACPAPYNSSYLTFSDQITSRSGFGQGAPGVFGAGDLDGDGDIDLAVSGDGDRRLWWIEQQAGGATALHQLTDAGEYFGQSGGGTVADFNGDGKNEMVFSSFDRNTVALWVRRPATPEPATPTTPATPVAKLTIPSTIQVGPESRTVKAGKKGTWTIRLAGAPGGAARQVSVVFDPKAKGTSVKVRTVTLKATSVDGVQRGSFSYKARKAGRFVVTYSGTTVSATLSDTKATDTAKVLIRRR
jgi:VCBS repeat protein